MQSCITIDIFIKLIRWLWRTCQFCSKAHQMFRVSFYLCARVGHPTICNVDCGILKFIICQIFIPQSTICGMRVAGCPNRAQHLINFCLKGTLKLQMANAFALLHINTPEGNHILILVRFIYTLQFSLNLQDTSGPVNSYITDGRVENTTGP